METLNERVQNPLKPTLAITEENWITIFFIPPNISTVKGIIAMIAAIRKRNWTISNLFTTLSPYGTDSCPKIRPILPDI